MKNKIDFIELWAESYRVFWFMIGSKTRLIHCSRCMHVHIPFYSVHYRLVRRCRSVSTVPISGTVCMILLTTQFFFHSVTEAYNKYIRNVILFHNILHFVPKWTICLHKKAYMTVLWSPFLQGFFFLFFFLLYNEHCPQIDVNRENQYIKQYW